MANEAIKETVGAGALFLWLVLLSSYSAVGAGPWPQDCQDDYSMPSVYRPADFLSGSSLSLGDDVISRTKLYSFNRFEQVTHDGKKWIDWKFNPKEKTANPSLNFLYKITMVHGHFPFKPKNIPCRFSLTAKNNSTFSMKVRGGKQEAYKLKTGQEKNLVFESDDLRLTVTGTQKDTDYSLLLKDLVLYYPVFDTAVTIEGDSLVRPDKDVMFNVSTAPAPIAGTRNFDLEICDRQWVLWRIRLNEKEIKSLQRSGKVQVKRRGPWYLPPGNYAMFAVVDGRRVSSQNSFTIKAENKNTSLPVMSRENHNGVPTIFMNGDPFIWSGFATYSFFSGSVNQFGYSNADVFFIPTSAGRHVHNIAAATWYGDQEYDFGSLQESVCKALAANPNAKLVFRVSLLLPPVWLKDHPDSAATIRTKDGLDVAWEETQSPAISLVSEDWRRQQKEVLKKLVRFCMSQPWSKNVISFFPTGGVTEEWFSWACNQGHYSDYSAVNQAAFAQWCKDEQLDFDSIPDPSAREDSRQMFFPDTCKGRWAAAYYSYYNEVNAETVEYFAKTIKDVTGGKSLVGTIYGYLIQLAGEPRQSTAAQFNLRRLVDSPYIDYLTGIPLLDFRRLTNDGYDTTVTARASILTAGKLYNNENDLLSWLHNDLWHTEYDKADPRAACISMHHRVHSANCIYGSPQQWFGLFPTWHSDKALHDDFAKQNEFLKKSLDCNRNSLEEVAFIVDEDSFVWKSPHSTFWRFTHKYLLRSFGLTGAPVDVWMLSDIDRLPDRIRFVVIADASAAKPENIAKLKRVIEDGQKTFLVVGLPGYIDYKTGCRSEDKISDLLGFVVKVDNSGGTAIIKRASDGKLLAEMDSRQVAPRAYVDRADFIRYEDGLGAGKSIRLKKGGRLIWSAVPPYQDVQLLRSWMEEAGVHFYSPVQIFVRASEELVSVTSVFQKDAEIELNWPKTVNIEDVYEGWKGHGKKIKCPFRYGQTRLFKVR